MVQIKNTIYVVEVGGVARDTCTESRALKYIADFVKSDVEVFQVGKTFVLNNINNTVGFVYPLTEVIERV